MRRKNTMPILVADDDIEDCEMIREALAENRLLNEIKFFHDGEQMVSFLLQRHQDSQLQKNLLPGLILLDLNMPKMNGREVLEELQRHSHLRHIPVVVLTTSQVEEDILRSYNLGASSFVTKPVAFQSLVTAIRNIGRHWLEIVDLPEGEVI